MPERENISVKNPPCRVCIHGGDQQMNVVPGPGNKEKLSELIDKHERELLHLCCVVLRDLSMAEDAVQETFLKAFRHMDTFRGECSERTWLYRIALNVCRDMRRSKWLRMLDRSVDIDTLQIPVQGASDGSIALMQEIMRLPVRQREVIFLFYYQDMTLAEIGSMLGAPVSTVGDRLNRARKQLRKALKGG